MKIGVSYIAIVVCLFISLLACKKDKASAQNQQTINVTLEKGETYLYNLGSFGDEEGASITQQAFHYDTSRIDRGFSTSTFYRYKSASGYVGKDEVEIKSARGSDGESPNDKIVVTNIKFTITN